MAQNLAVGKNPLWTAYQDAGSLVRDEIILELKRQGLFRYWLVTASKEGYDLKKKVKAPMRDIFIRLMPETATLFGLPVPRGAAGKKKAAVNDGTLSLFS
ncbi:hypothetical protein [Spirosoma sordidisoli]|uniref:Uncharacterized protein n=1 Tax=Spirosoma sordidisoli TaxID=2502893 RepID=A0A4Q2UQC0_9BACT|nr:hypothetical protein [Spirosoma sordidisoli]RYC69840.1 hypothetical protein EQG79_14700 [Spirosoma sordidisoli]